MIKNGNFDLSDPGKRKAFIVPAFLIYLVCLIINIASFIYDLTQYLHRTPMPELSADSAITLPEYLDILEAGAAPSLGEVILKAVYVISFLLLLVFFIPAFRTRYSKTASGFLCAALAAAVCSTMKAFPQMLMSIRYPALLPGTLVLLAIACLLLYMCRAAWKRKISLPAYALLIVMLIINKGIYADAIVFIMLSILNGAQTEPEDKSSEISQ